MLYFKYYHKKITVNALNFRVWMHLFPYCGHIENFVLLTSILGLSTFNVRFT